MNGLDKIISGIALDAKTEAERITADAQKEAERIISDAKNAAAKTEQDGKTAAESEYNRIITRAKSADEVTAARIILREKQRVVSEIIDGAKAKITSMEPEPYFEYMVKLLDRYAEDKPGSIILSDKDKQIKTAAFCEALKARKLEISDKACDTEAGFILVYGDIEENCTIDALLEAERDRLHDEVSRFLFGEV